MYIKKPEFIAGDDQVCSPHMNALPLAGASALGERHFCPKNLPIYLSIYHAPGSLYQRPALS